MADAEPRVLFLPGVLGAPEFWHPVGERLPRAWEKVYFGWPGLGDQPPDPAVRGFDDLVALVAGRWSDHATWWPSPWAASSRCGSPCGTPARCAGWC